eukprot:TRINITY_DN13066_c0_g1::TRINITY_DN13066_c0_g1_i1::g.10698::m.10698 TRINITY_DN13066_c0_g1::TRINITY_DN13066_c0_g1_i1::g.10698  ORF type:complete len:250 (-),score=91.88,sp/P48774/GSTM5_MOUSE/52.51/3e-79,GST_N/PF02798.15/2.1e-17,GST_C/PF00043.20/1.6e-13,GST_C/PF00043.20/4.3e+03,GST_C_2/PF13410.1/3.3e-08,GST_C_3/PF14497.1/2e-07,GST_N_3/PF13417.1/0.00016,GST_N_2/PF13409.1/0.031 TRINITY_DN13066_c0_g1_i1:151-861(-)
MIELGYWDIRGLAQPIRLLLAYTGVEYRNILYTCGNPPDYDRSSWFNVKEKLGFDFPNLPYLIDDEVKLTQSNAILRYLGRKFGLEGGTEAEKQRIDLIAEESMDFRNSIVRLCYNPSFDELFSEWMQQTVGRLHRFEAFLGDSLWFAGDKLTWVDFIMYELLDQSRIMVPDILQDFPKLAAYLQRFEEIPEIKEYMQSARFMRFPLNNKTAKFGESDEEAARKKQRYLHAKPATA